MESNKEKEPEENKAAPADDAATPGHDALSQEPSDTAASSELDNTGGKSSKKLSVVKKVSRRFNVYYLAFALVLIAGGAVTLVAMMASKKPVPIASASNQKLTTSELKQLADSNATVGGSGETLTVGGNAVLAGNVLMRSNLAVAGSVQLGGPFTAAQLSTSGSTNLANTQINGLQVSGSTILHGPVTVQDGLNLSGVSSFGGPITASQLTVANLTVAGVENPTNQEIIGIEIPGHVGISGTTPHISTLSGLGGSASIVGSDTSGTVTMNTGGNPSGCMVQVNFNQSFKNNLNSPPNVIVSPISTQSAPIDVQAYAGSVNDTSFQICAANPANTLPAHQQFAVSYFVTAPEP